jgi:K+-transporting ATPase KdpF subunit
VENSDARCDHAVLHRHLFRRRVPLRQSLSKAEVVAMHQVMDWIGLVISILLLAYLTLAMLYPEKF